MRPITINHVASASAPASLRRGSAFGRFYFGFVAVWAVAGGGLYRRVVRAALRGAARWLGPVSPESGVIAPLIFILMVTYLAGLRLGETGARHV